MRGAAALHACFLLLPFSSAQGHGGCSVGGSFAALVLCGAAAALKRDGGSACRRLGMHAEMPSCRGVHTHKRLLCQLHSCKKLVQKPKSASSSPAHLAQKLDDPSNPLSRDEDNVSWKKEEGRESHCVCCSLRYMRTVAKLYAKRTRGNGHAQTIYHLPPRHHNPPWAHRMARRMSWTRTTMAMGRTISMTMTVRGEQMCCIPSMSRRHADVQASDTSTG